MTTRMQTKAARHNMRKAQPPAARKKPVAHMPKNPQRGTGRPAANMSKPGMAKPAMSKPGMTKPAMSKPGMTKPGTRQASMTMTKPRAGTVQRGRMSPAPKTRAELYELARRCDLPGRSRMDRAQLARMLGER